MMVEKQKMAFKHSKQIFSKDRNESLDRKLLGWGSKRIQNKDVESEKALWIVLNFNGDLIFLLYVNIIRVNG